jgi:hypothetical protein
MPWTKWGLCRIARTPYNCNYTALLFICGNSSGWIREMGQLRKFFSPSVSKRVTQKIPIFPELTTMLTGHGKIGSYIYRLGLTDNPMCPCEEEEQTVDHLIFKCKKLRNQRNEIRQIKDTGWQLACNE